MHHLIKKQVLELTLVTEHDMFRMQQQASQYYYSHILPAIEKSLDALTDADHLIQLDKLEIDLGVIDWKQQAMSMNEEELNHVIETETRKAVQRVYDQNYLTGKYNRDVPGIKKRVALHAGEQWLFYMRKGYLPWNLMHPDDAWRMQVLEALATDFGLVAQLRSLIENNPDALARLVYDHPVSFLVQLAGVLTATPQLSLPLQLQQLKTTLYPDHTESNSIKEVPGKYTGLLWQQVLQGIAGGDTVPDVVKKIEKDADTGRDIKTEPVKDNTVVENKNNEKLHDEIFAVHAGLILLHPFYKTLFTHTGVTENGQFINDEAKEKAVWLLHYVATGNTTAADYELVVPKILCGFPLVQSPSPDSLPTAVDLEEAMNMISAAIEQWAILKNTSTDGLREGFLQRSGKIYSAGGNLCFAVEPHAIDVLLDHLPWNLSIVKLPWVKELIQVTWR